MTAAGVSTARVSTAGVSTARVSTAGPAAARERQDAIADIR
jgi:hypothetical protein